MNTPTLAAALESATDALSAIGTRASCAPNDDADAADRELGKIMREAFAARDAAALTLNAHRSAAAPPPTDTTAATLIALATPEDADQATRTLLALRVLAGVPTLALASLSEHPARMDSLATVARVLGALKHLGDAAAVAAVRAVTP